jgi:hypothetical protein
VYDMYPWSSVGPGGRPPGTPRERGDYPSPRTPLAPRASADVAARASADAALTSAVQFSLDRRDNGGDAASVPAPGAARQ